MLTPLIIELLIGSFLLLLGGWLSDTLHGSTQNRANHLNPVGAIGWDQHQFRRIIRRSSAAPMGWRRTRQ